ncbi:MAG: hypothetical protein KKD86_14650 [Bacteroidetes bacterium]|nr:hypothetical protein [Bacteroidota bacterium]MBU1680063.1 hypothetical protein [Bacteroidota bacterium]
MKKYLVPAFIAALAAVIIAFFLRPLGTLFDAILTQLAMKDIKMFLLQSVIILMLILLFLFSLIAWLLKKYHYKKNFRFSVYWNKIKPYCPHCGGSLLEGSGSYLECKTCKERLYLVYEVHKPLSLKEAQEIIQKES